jgi:hypothetical protein
MRAGSTATVPDLQDMSNKRRLFCTQEHECRQHCNNDNKYIDDCCTSTDLLRSQVRTSVNEKRLVPNVLLDLLAS